MKRIYVAGPMTQGAYMENIRRGVQAGAALRDAGFAPFIPHLGAFWTYLEPRAYEDWIEYDLVWVEACHALLRLPGDSPGADREVAHAQLIGIPVFHSVEEVVASL